MPTMPGMPIDKRGALLVFGSALAWSMGGAIDRFLHLGDSWLVVFWRSAFASAFLFGFMLSRQGIAASGKQVLAMGLPGLGVALCIATSSIAFVVALTYTTVANVVLMLAGVPLLAALLGFVLFGEAVSRATWAAIACVIAGVSIMVSASLGDSVSAVGNGLALLMAAMFACATVITRRHAHVAMMPAVALGTLLAAVFAASMVSRFGVSAAELGLLFLFGAANLGLGMALFATGARLIPAAVAGLIGTAEMVLGPVWVWLLHGEVPGLRTLLGGGVVFLALLAHLGWQFHLQNGQQRKFGAKVF